MLQTRSRSAVRGANFWRGGTLRSLKVFRARNIQIRETIGRVGLSGLGNSTCCSQYFCISSCPMGTSRRK
ncbi:hypothetical protein EI94DRAFT_1740057 [Lactarius quietus]|nr:hypothetical protein EI94DRAFT_1740057 [Lactarius quietus]